MRKYQVVGVMLIVLISTGAIAQTSGTIDVGGPLQGLQPAVISFVTTVVGAVGTWVLYYVRKYLGVKIDDAQAETYLRASKNYASSLVADGFVIIRENGKVEIPNAALAAAANDLLKSVPDAVAHFKISLEDAMKKIIDMIPQVPAAPVIIAATAQKPPR